MSDITEIAELISEDPGFKRTDIARVRAAAKKTGRSERVSARTHGSQVVDPYGKNIGLFDAIEGSDAEAHVRDEFTYLVFPVKKRYQIVINAVPSYLVPRSTKVQIAISPKGTPQAIGGDRILGYMDPSGELVVILGYNDELISWFPISDGEEPWNMTALKGVEEHMHLARAGVTYRVGELESYLGGSFDIVRESDVFRQES